MKHQPFEDWLFSSEPLAPSETAALQAHLQNCDSCRQLSGAWIEVEDWLKRSPVVAPASGFVNRWQDRLAAEQQRLHRRQSLAMLGFSIGAAFLLFSSLVILTLPLLKEPNVLFWTSLYRLMSIFSVANTASDFLIGLGRSLPAGVPLIGWVLLAGVLSELCVLWVVSFRLLTNPRRVSA